MFDFEDFVRGDTSGADKSERMEHKADDPGETSLELHSHTRKGIPEPTIPVPKPPTNDWTGQRMAKEESRRLARMKQQYIATVVAMESTAAVCVAGANALDRSSDAIMQNYLGRSRRSEMNQYMGEATVEILDLMRAGVFAIMETYPKRIGDYL